MRLINIETITDETILLRYHKELVEMDMDAIEDLTQDLCGNAEYWHHLCRNHRRTWRVFLDEKEQACAYFHFQGLHQKMVDQIVQGEFDESHLSPDDILMLDEPGEYTAYFFGIAIREDQRTPRNIMMVFKAFYQCLEDLADEGIYFKEWYADAMTPEGEYLCRKFGMLPLIKHHTAGTIYHTQKLHLPKSAVKNNYPLILNYYKEK